MEKSKVDNLKSIVAQRLALFNSLERGHPRTDSGRPVTGGGQNFIFKRGTSEEILSDIQREAKSKISPGHTTLFENTVRNTQANDKRALSKENMEASRKLAEPNSDDSPGFTVRQRMAVFETNSGQRSTSEERIGRICQRGNAVSPVEASSSPLQQNRPKLNAVGRAQSMPEGSSSPLTSPGRPPITEGGDAENVSGSPKTTGRSPENGGRKTSTPPREKPALSPKNFPRRGENGLEGAHLQQNGENEYRNIGASSIDDHDNHVPTNSHFDGEDSNFCQQSRSFPPPSKALPTLPLDLNQSNEKPCIEKPTNGNVGVTGGEKTGYKPDLPPKEVSLHLRPKGKATESVYIQPSFKVSGMQRPPEQEENMTSVPIKQRTLGRGEIKPYEIVTIVTTESDSNAVNDSKVQVNERQKDNRMESMYVYSFGNPPLDASSGDLKPFEERAYQEIPDHGEPEKKEWTLDANEFDLSYLNSEGSIASEKLISISEEGKLHVSYESQDIRLSDEVDNMKIVNDENRNNYRKAALMSDSSFDSSRTDTLSSSILSEVFEGWDSDELDDYTDDEILDGRKRQSMTIDVDAAKKKIWNIVNEILATEKAYTKRLHLLEKFQARLLKEARESNVVPEKVVQEIFSNLSSICTFHSTMLLPDLEKRITNWSSNEKIGDIFKTLGHCLKLYTDYVKNFDHATTTLNQWMKKSPKFASIVEELQKQPECEHLTLQHHMLGPIQRVPRYRLLLQDYVKKLPKDSPDRAEAEESLSVISEAANHSNNSMKGMEQFKKLVEIEERIVEGLQGESLATASRVFLKEGELQKIAARSDQRQARVLLLFNDLVLCCNRVPPVGKLKVRQMMDISGMTVQDSDEDLGQLNAFRIRSRQRVLDLATSSQEEKTEWISAISSVIKDYEAKRGSVLKQHLEQEAKKESNKADDFVRVGESAPVWVKDEDVTMCMLCAVRFSLLSRRHHCRACGRIVCDNCSKYKAQLSYMNNTVKRVCYVCHKKLNADRLQETDSFIQKSFTLAQVNRDPKRRRSTLVTEMKGELMWKAPGKGWAKGYFSISDMVLYVQKGKKDPKAQMTIALPGYTVTRPTPVDEIDESKHPHAFKLHFGSKKEMTYFFRADNEATTQRWIDVITYSIKAEKPPPQYKTL